MPLHVQENKDVEFIQQIQKKPEDRIKASEDKSGSWKLWDLILYREYYIQV